MKCWLRNTTLGEALGIGGVAVAYAAADRGMAPLVPAVLVAGAWEGLCLGTAQALVLRRAGIGAAGWIAATVVAAVAGYALSLAGGAGSGAQDAAGPGPAAMLALAALGGAVMGLVMGGVQWLAARHALGLRSWVLRNGIGWAVAMAAIFAGAGLATAAMPLWQVALLGAASGAVAGLALGLATRGALPTQ